MTFPYTNQPLEAFMAAQTAVGLVLASLVWLRRMRPWLSSVLFLLAVALVVSAPVSGETLGAVGVIVGPEHIKTTLRVAAALATLAALFTGRLGLIAIALVGEAALWPVTTYIKDSDWELAGLHLAYLGFLLGVHYRERGPRTVVPKAPVALPKGVWIDDVVAFFAGTLLACVVCRVVLHGWTNSGDEWANTFEAALFAKLHAASPLPECSEAFRSFWIFPYMGRTVPEYTPGWPYFMTPFVALGVPWLAGPASLGVLAAGASRLGRRAAGGFVRSASTPPAAFERAAGRFAAAAIMLGATMLINGASRYPHVFVAAMYAWSVEALLAITERAVPSPLQWRWGIVLGGAASLLLAARPGDGAMLGIGLFFYFVYALVWRRPGWRATAGAALAFGALGLLSLVILRLQLGKWFQTGYSLNTIYYPWNKFAWSVPKASEYRSVLPFMAGSYNWLPCAPALAAAGLAACRGRGQHMGIVFVLSYVPYIAFYSMLEVGRKWDLGYGPRYELPWVVPMAVGTGLVLAQLWAVATAHAPGVSALQAGGPVAVALVGLLVGVVRVAPLVYGPTYADVQTHNRLHEALAARPDIHDAIVFAGAGLNNTDPMDLTENLPLDLYPNQDVLIALDRTPGLVRCVQRDYPTRRYYRAVAGTPVRIEPY